METQRTRRALLSLTACGIAVSFSAGAAWSLDIEGASAGDGVQLTGLSRAQLAALGDTMPGAAGAAYKGPFYRYKSTSYCSTAEPGQGNPTQPSCTGEFAVCNRARTSGATAGPAVWVWRIEVNSDGSPAVGSAWDRINFTCLASLVP